MCVAYLVVFAPLTEAIGLPARAAYVTTVALVVLPCLWLPLRRVEVWNALPRRTATISGLQMTLILIGLFGWAGIVISVGSGVDEWLRERVFFWLPPSVTASVAVETAGYPASILVGTRVASLVVIGIVAPILEELYFRGFLLPRMPWRGATRILAHCAMFAGFHFLSPWAVVTRMLLLIPMVALVWRTGRLSIGIWLHCGGNTAGELLILAAVIDGVR